MSSPPSRWKDLPESEMPDDLQMGPSYTWKKAFVPDAGPINAATLKPPTEPSMLRTTGSNIRWTNVFNILVIAAIVIFLLSLNY